MPGGGLENHPRMNGMTGIDRSDWPTPPEGCGSKKTWRYPDGPFILAWFSKAVRLGRPQATGNMI